MLQYQSYATGKGDPKAQFKKDRIPGSSFFDMDNIADKSSTLPHMLPTEAAFAAAADALGITSDTQVVVYDRLGVFSAARVWWTFQVFSHPRLVITRPVRSTSLALPFKRCKLLLSRS